MLMFVQQRENAKTACIFGLVGPEVPAPDLTWRSARCRSALEIPKRFMRRCILLTLIPSSRRIRAILFPLTSKPSRRISAVMRR